MRSSLVVTSALLSIRGFSIIELTIVVTVLTVLVGLGLGTVANYQLKARDSERASDIEIISQNLERQYKTQAVAIGPTYPASTTTSSALAALINDSDATYAPNQSTNSLVIATTSGNQTPTISQYMYQPLNIDDTLCTATPCVRYKLYYHLESTDAIVSVDSMRQQ